MDDLISSFDEEFEEEPATGELVTKTPEDRLPIAMWGQFCFDLVMLHPNHSQVCLDYNITEDHLLELLSNKPFLDRLKDAQLQVKTLGPSAGFVLTARTEAERHLVTLGKIADQESVHPGVRVKAIENIVRYAHLDPQSQKQVKESEQRATSPGVLVQFNFGKGLLGPTPRTIEVQRELLGGMDAPDQG